MSKLEVRKTVITTPEYVETHIYTPASMIQVGHIVHNRNADAPLEVLSVEGRSTLVSDYYHVVIGRNGEEVYSVDIPDKQTLTYVYVDRR